MKTKPHTPAAAPAPAAHTPGPLEYDPRTFYSHGDAVSLITHNGMTIAEVLGEEDTRRANADHMALCWNSHEALLAALTVIAGNPMNSNACRQFARAAIAKAGAQ